jgi:hypothetical protein
MYTTTLLFKGPRNLPCEAVAPFPSRRVAKERLLSNALSNMAFRASSEGWFGLRSSMLISAKTRLNSDALGFQTLSSLLY